MAALPTSCAAAKASGAKRYFTGTPCKRGHVAFRYVGGGCSECCRLRKLENSASERERLQKWRKENPEKVRASDAKKQAARQVLRKPRILIGAKKSRKNWRDRNIEYDRQKCREWHRVNRERSLTNCRNRRARKAQAEGKHTAAEIATLYELQHGKCANCLTSLKPGYHADHIVPLARGGSNWISNIQLLCPPCNISKGAKTPEEWELYKREIA